MEKIKEKLKTCYSMLKKGCKLDIDLLNIFCAEFLRVANDLQQHVKQNKCNTNHYEMICLCLTQVIICIKCLETTIRSENVCGAVISASRQHFLGRIRWCIKRLLIEIPALHNEELIIEDNALFFITLVDRVMETLAPFSNYNDESSCSQASEHSETVSLSKHIRRDVDSILGHALAFANVALAEDKKALSALCQKLLRDCVGFENECTLNSVNYSNRKLKAIALEHALYRLEDFINEALLRLMFTCFLDFEKLGIDRLRTIFQNSPTEDSCVDAVIADFDVNIDRITQIGIFAIGFAPNIKIKTILRSCLASFESLDTTLIPALQSNGSELHSELLEQHYNEEVIRFKKSLQEIIDSCAFVNCYLEMLTNLLTVVEKKFDLLPLQDMAQMGSFLVEHFQLASNRKNITDQQHFQEFIKMIRECKAILVCGAQVEPQRIIKRFKILRSSLRKLDDSLKTKQIQKGTTKAQNIHSVENIVDSALSIMPTTSIILYESRRSKNLGSTKVKGGNSLSKDIRNYQKPIKPPLRKESLRTSMFKRQNLAESKKAYDSIITQSENLHITDILDQLTSLSSNFSEMSRKMESIAH